SERTKRQGEEAERSERQTWIEKHGSSRLKRLAKEGIECLAVYRDERLAVERPGWRWANEVPGNASDPRNPPEEALDLLDLARQTAPDAELQYSTVRHSHDENCYGDDCPEFDWRG